MPVSTDTITIRELHPEELGKVRDLGRRAFSLPMGLLMAATVSPQGWVAQDTSGTIIGALTIRIAHIGKHRVGILDWAVVDPLYQGHGIGKAMLEQALVWMRQQKCDKIVTTGVDGYNSPSWNAAHACGLRYWPVVQQLREFRWHWLKLLLVIPHIGVSTFILHLPTNEQEQEPPTTSGVRAIIGVILFLGFFLLPVSSVRNVAWESLSPSALLTPLNPATLLWGAILTGIYLGMRSTGQWLAARTQQLSLTFRLWDSGLIMATLLAVAFGAFIPAFAGSFYIRQSRFNYTRAYAEMGKIMLAGAVPSLVLLAVFTLWIKLSPTNPGAVVMLGQYIGVSLALSDTVLFFPPFQSLPAGHIWRWRRAIWFIGFVCFLVIWLVLPYTP